MANQSSSVSLIKILTDSPMTLVGRVADNSSAPRFQLVDTVEVFTDDGVVGRFHDQLLRI
jgi:hypothetical protein